MYTLYYNVLIGGNSERESTSRLCSYGVRKESFFTQSGPRKKRAGRTSVALFIVQIERGRVRTMENTL
jgi:hypothetical protein